MSKKTIKGLEAEILRLRKKLREKKSPLKLDSSLSELENKTGIDRATWSKWLSGSTSPTVRTLARVAPHLGMSVGQLADIILYHVNSKR